MPTIAVNKQALHDHDILQKFEAGLVLSGQEVKSVRAGHVSLKAAYATIHDGQVQLTNAHISPYPNAHVGRDYDPTRSRTLLLSKKEIARLIGQLQQKGLTLLPLSLYTRGSRIKVELGLGRGRKQFEKRELLKKRAVTREIRHELKRGS